MAGGQHPATLAVGDHGQAQLLGGLPRRVLGAAEPDVGAQDEHRPPRRPQQRGDPLDVRRVRGQDVQGRIGWPVRLGLPVDRLERDIEEHRPAVRAQRQPEGLLHRSRDLRRLVLGERGLGDGREQRRMVYFLQAARTPAVVRRASGEQHDRRCVEPGGRDRADRVRDARARGHHGQPGRPGQPCGRLGREHCGLLVPHVYQAQRRVGLDRRVVEREDVPAGQREQRPHAMPPRDFDGVQAAMSGYLHHSKDVTSQ